MTRTVLAVSAFLLATPAAAQVAGTYSGYTASGDFIQFDVSTDPQTGSLAVSSYFVESFVPCADGLLNYSAVYEFTYPTADIVDGRVRYQAFYPSSTIRFALKFDKQGAAADGVVASVFPALRPVGPHPRKGVACTTPEQRFAVTLSTLTSKFTPPPKKGTSMVYRERPH